ncbi:hypothetical protein ACQEWB_19235 [Streptomyces sp. CA-249302]|uniref:hypothetical protein n=1 Tax=Streptomyces sp. CA-249302 TaxID=3240058 RepID=UPI003D8CB5D2
MEKLVELGAKVELPGKALGRPSPCVRRWGGHPDSGDRPIGVDCSAPRGAGNCATSHSRPAVAHGAEPKRR